MMSQLGTLASKNSTRKPELMELSTININEFITISFFFNRQLLIMIIYVLAPNFTKKWTIILCGAGSVVLLMASHRRLNAYTEVRNTLTQFFFVFCNHQSISFTLCRQNCESVDFSLPKQRRRRRHLASTDDNDAESSRRWIFFTQKAEGSDLLMCKIAATAAPCQPSLEPMTALFQACKAAR